LNRLKIFSLLALITISEATIGVFVKLTNGMIPIQTLNFYALSCAAIFLLLSMSLIKRKPLEFPSDNIKDTVIIGFLIAAQSGLFNFAMTLVPIANAVIFWSVAPFFTFIFSWLFLNEKAKKSYIVIFVVALAGIFIAKPLQEGYMLGNMVALSVGVIYGAMVTYMRHEGKTETDNDIAWSLLVAALIFSPSLAWVGPGQVTATIYYQTINAELPVILWAICLGIISMGFAYFGISIVLRTLSANVYSLVDIIVSPIVATTLGFIIFTEIPSSNMIYGGIMLLGAGFRLSWEMSRSSQN
jgi:drug/metabolite transporter (DMT)-like permease